MEYYDKEFCLEVWGSMACFTRPELKVERVSYDVITPSAARAIFEAIFWKPAIHWQVTKIEVLNQIKWISVKRNEIGAEASKKPIYIDELDNNGKLKYRQPKSTLMLRDVRYRLWAKLVFIPIRKRIEANGQYNKFYDLNLGTYKASRNPLIDKEEMVHLRRDENPAKYNEMFERRARKGQCFNQPYLGTRECVASFKFVDLNDAQLSREECYYIDEGEIKLGIMFYDWDFSTIYDQQKKNDDNKDLKGPTPLFFRAVMNNGVIIVPPINSPEILR